MASASRVQGRKYFLLLATASAGTVLAPLNSTMLAVALPEIRDDFGVSLTSIGWLVSSYLIAMAVAQPLGGRIGDQLGRSTVFRLGLVAFLALSLLAALSPSFPILVALRTGQAVVGAAVIPNGSAMLRESLPTNRLGRATGLTGSVISFSAAIGPLIGGLLLAAGSWRLIFLANIPLVLTAFTFHLLLNYPNRRSSSAFMVDWLGTAALVGALVLVTALLGTLDGGTDPLFIAAALAGLAVCALVFWRQQLIARMPIVEWRLFRNRSYTAASLSVLLSNLVMYTTLLSIPFFIREVIDKGSATTGALLAGMSILTAIVTPLTGRLSDEHGRRLPAVCGCAVALGGVLLILASLSEDANVAYLAASLAVMGAGFGFAFGPAATAAIEAAPRELAGVAAGTNSMMRYLGSIVGAGVLGSVLSANDVPDVDVFRLLFVALAFVAVLALISSLFIHRFHPVEPEASAETLGPLGLAVSPDS